jgi:hypothetical protein
MSRRSETTTLQSLRHTLDMARSLADDVYARGDPTSDELNEAIAIAQLCVQRLTAERLTPAKRRL